MMQDKIRKLRRREVINLLVLQRCATSQLNSSAVLHCIGHTCQ